VLILDTNVISEVLRPEPNETVVTWFESQPRRQLFTTAVTQAEILYGITILPKGQKLLQVAQLIFEEDLENHVLPFSGDTAGHYADIVATRKSSGRPIRQFDAMIAAIARQHGGNVATRNVSDFDHCGIDLLNPWDSAAVP
jgi:predicted nucleic acid-binding protein